MNLVNPANIAMIVEIVNAVDPLHKSELHKWYFISFISSKYKFLKGAHVEFVFMQPLILRSSPASEKSNSHS